MVLSLTQFVIHMVLPGAWGYPCSPQNPTTRIQRGYILSLSYFNCCSKPEMGKIKSFQNHHDFNHEIAC